MTCSLEILLFFLLDRIIRIRVGRRSLDTATVLQKSSPISHQPGQVLPKAQVRDHFDTSRAKVHEPDDRSDGKVSKGADKQQDQEDLANAGVGDFLDCDGARVRGEEK